MKKIFVRSFVSVRSCPQPFKIIRSDPFIRLLRSFDSFDLLHAYTRIYAPVCVPIYIAGRSSWEPGGSEPRNAAGTDRRNGKKRRTKKVEKKVKNICGLKK